MAAQAPAQTAQQQMAAQNAQARDYIVRFCPEIRQQIFSASYPAGAAGQVINITPRAVGLIKKFVVKITGTIAQAATETLTLTPFGAANVLSSITYSDLSNTTRIQTTGWHLTFLASVRPTNLRQVYGAAYTTDTPFGFGNNFTVVKVPAAVTTAQNFQTFYEVPLAYADTDLRGSVFAAVLNATQQLQLQINPNFVAASTANGNLSVYKSSTAANLGALTNVTVTVYQVYKDQLPQNGGTAVFPILDVSTVYELKQSALTGLVVGQDFPIGYANQREFLSTMAILDQNGTLNAGTDVNYLSLTAANAFNFFKEDPFTHALITRQLIGDDFPPGCYYFEHRMRPINTLQVGNMQLNINPSQAVAGAAVYVGWEAFAYANTITNGASLSAS